MRLIENNIDKIDYIECKKEFILYNGNILRFSVSNYAECITKMKIKKFQMIFKTKQ